jgi:hypothetical protein
MIPDPKPKRVDISPEDYTKLRRKVYEEQDCKCIKCKRWFPFHMFSLHHKDHKSKGGGDVRENVDGYCLGCHPA